ncbi:MAG: thioredoxin domain-containing protein [Rhodoglobus sp.]|nr:thioredoxin domain-containing protein [Rhodoglobus sp.]
MNTNTKVALGFTAVVILIVLAFITVAIMQAQTRPQAIPDPDTGLAPTVREDSHRLTSPESSTVTFVEFLDFECEACGAAFPYVEELRAEYGDRVTFVMRYFPLPSHLNSKNAAVAAEAAARQGELEVMYQKLFESQSQWGEKQDSQAPLFRTYAEELGLDMEQYDADVADPSTLERVKSDFDDGRALGVSSTPTMYVNDVLVELTSLDDIRAAIENALAE